MDCSPPGSSVHGILRQEYWSGLPFPSLQRQDYLPQNWQLLPEIGLSSLRCLSLIPLKWNRCTSGGRHWCCVPFATLFRNGHCLLSCQRGACRPVTCFLSSPNPTSPVEGCWGQARGLPCHGKLLSCGSQPGKARALKEWYSAPSGVAGNPAASPSPLALLPDAPGELECLRPPGGGEGGQWAEPGSPALTVVSRETDEEFAWLGLHLTPLGIEETLEMILWASLVAQTVKNLSTMQEPWVLSLDWEDSMEKGMATHSSVLPWRIPWTKEPGGLQSMRSQSWIQLSD